MTAADEYVDRDSEAGDAETFDWDTALAVISEDVMAELEILDGPVPEHLLLAEKVGVSVKVTRYNFESFAEHMVHSHPETFPSVAAYTEDHWREHCAEIFRDRETWADRARLHDPGGINWNRAQYASARRLTAIPDAIEWLEKCADSWAEKALRDEKRKAVETKERLQSAGYVDFTDPAFWEPPTPRVFVPRMILEGQVGTIYSPGGVGKSLMSLDICVGLTVRGDLFGEPVEPTTVIYLDRENGTRTLSKRLIDMGLSSADQTTLAGRLHYSLLGSIPALDTSAGGHWLCEEVARTGAKFVVIDTLSKVVEGEENANPTWQALHNLTMAYLKRSGVTVLELDHSGKDLMRGQRGAGAKRDNVDVVWRLETVKKGQLFRVTNEKDRDGDFGGEGTTHHLVRETHPALRHRFATTAEILAMSASKESEEASGAQTKVLDFIDAADGPVPKRDALKILGGENSRSRAIVQPLIDDQIIEETTGSKGIKFLTRTPRTCSDMSGQM